MFREWREGIGEDKPDTRPEVLPEEALPWVDLTPSVELDHPVASHYMSYIVDRPDSVVAALRAIGEAPGAALVHCAAGKDRTGTVVALALLVAGADREAVIDDYVASTERMEAIVGRLMSSDTYAENLRDRPVSANNTQPETMQAFLEHIDTEYGGVEKLLDRLAGPPTTTPACAPSCATDLRYWAVHTGWDAYPSLRNTRRGSDPVGLDHVQVGRVVGATPEHDL